MTYRSGAEFPRTSIVSRETTPPVTVQFNSFTPWRETAYQKDQLAGFSEEEAALLVRRGLARIVGRV